MWKRFVTMLRRPKWRFGSYSALIMSLLVAIGVLVNVAVNSLEANYGWRRDFSFNGYTMTGKETGAALSALTEPVTLYLLYQSNDLDSELYEVLMRYHRLSSLITVKTVDLAKNPGFISLFESDLQSSITTDTVVVSCETTGRHKVLSYEDFITQGYNIGTGSFEIAGLAYEKSVTEAILYVSQSEIPVVSISQGHGELTTDTMQTLVGFLQSNSYDVRTVNLLAGDTLDNTDLLIIADPYKDFTQGEIEQLKAYAQNGGNFFVIRDYTDPLDLQNYQALLKSYGVIPLPGIVVAGEEDNGSYYGERIYLLPYFNYMDMTLPLIESGRDVLLLVGASAFEPPDGKTDASLSAVTVLKSGVNAYLRDVADGDSSIDYREGDRKGEQTLAILAARMHSNGNISRMFAIGNSTVFTDEYIYQRTFNQVFILQLLGELLPQKNVSLDIAAKPALRPALTVRGAGPAIALLASLPVLILLLAMFVLVPRKNR